MNTKQTVSNETKHTPGPWRVTPSGGIAGQGEAVVLNWESDVPECSGQKAINNGFGRAEANAKLIAAAPELLSLLKDALCVLNAHAVGLKTQKAIEAGVAKAEGKTL